MELSDELSEEVIKQLYGKLVGYRFKRGDWVLKKGKLFTYEGHSCSRCKVEDHSGIEIVNKNNSEDKFVGWFDWVHTKPCTPENANDKSKLFVYWELIEGDKKLAEKYSVITFSYVGAIPRWVLNKFGVIYK